MPRVDVVVQSSVPPTFRVCQIAGIFDLPATGHSSLRFSAEIPALDEPWQIGLIVGPSGSGKSTIARAAFPNAIHTHASWPADAAVIDGFPNLPVKRIIAAFTAVGFSSPPAWLRPFRVLSNGQQFRCELARALLAGKPLVLFDEFTSVVDRTVARVSSAAVASAIRSHKLAQRFVAVSCHYDIIPWLQPDWVLDMSTGQLARGRLHRPEIPIHLFRTSSRAWRLFAHHHYLTASLHPSATCFLAVWEDRPVAFCAKLPFMGRKNHDRITRLVVLPDYQGIGIGHRLLDAVARLSTAQSRTMNITTSHPALLQALAIDPNWTCTSVRKSGHRPHAGQRPSAPVARLRPIASFRFTPKPAT